MRIRSITILNHLLIHDIGKLYSLMPPLTMPRPKVVCTCGLRLPSGTPLPIGAGLEFIISGLLGKNLLKRGWYAKNLGKICFFQAKLCYHAVHEGIRIQEQKLWEIFPGQEVPKTIFDCGGQGCLIISE
jgi:hypothetical protein